MQAAVICLYGIGWEMQSERAAFNHFEMMVERCPFI